MTTTTLDMKVQDFLAQKRIAVAGVSRDKSHHPVGNVIYHRLKTTGHEVFAVNPHMQTFEGDRCYPDLQSIPGGVDGVVIITRPTTTQTLLVGNTIALVAAMTYDWTVNAIGPFELTEYLGLAFVYAALAMTARPSTLATLQLRV